MIVSTACAFFSNTVSYWITTYRPSGAPGRDFVYWLDFELSRDQLPQGSSGPGRPVCHCSLVTAPLKSLAAWSQLSEYFC